MTASEVQGILHTIGLRPQQAAGQNFLLDESVAEGMVTAAGVEDGQTVLEIGPGLGILTKALLKRGANVIAIELDSRLYAFLKKTFRGQERLRLVHDDIFKVNLNKVVKDNAYTLVANLPYSATSLVFRNFLTMSPRPVSMTIMVQREVAKRICAQPGEMSVLALSVQYYSQPSLLFDVSPSSFYPIPQVTSSVLHCGDIQPTNLKMDKELFRFIKAGFSSRRKKLSNALSTILAIPAAEIELKMAKVSLKNNIRAQELSLQNWLTLKKEFS